MFNITGINSNISKFKKTPFTRLSAEECNKKFPQFKIDSESEAVFQANGAVVYADKAVQAFWSTLQYTSSGDEVVGVKLLNKDNKKTGQNESSFEITLKSGRKYYCDKLVLAAGAWTNQVLQLAHVSTLPLQVTNEQATYYEIKNTPEAQKIDFTVNAMPTFISHHTDPPKNKFGYYGIPHVPGGVAGVKASSHRVGEILPNPNPNFRDFGVNQDLMSITDPFVQKFLPHLDVKKSSVVRCMYTCSPDLHFIVGPHPDCPSLFVAAGFSGHGFKFATGIGEILANMVCDRPMHPFLHPEYFRVSRFFDKKYEIIQRTGC